MARSPVVAWDAVIDGADRFGDAILYEEGVARRGPIAEIERDGFFVVITLQWMACRRIVSDARHRIESEWRKDESRTFRVPFEQAALLDDREVVRIPLGRDIHLKLVPRGLGQLPREELATAQ